MESTVESAQIMAGNTKKQYDEIIGSAREIFLKKNKDYGTSWRILRSSSLTDQIFIKAQRIRSIEEKGGVKMVNESIDNEFLGIINYCIIALIQTGAESNNEPDLNSSEVLKHFDFHAQEAKRLMENKNHDYGEAWRSMRISSMTDLILMKLLRIKQIEDNRGETLISEGVQANYYDIINYAVFALIKMKYDN
jgi:uncharacterized membrane protein